VCSGGGCGLVIVWVSVHCILHIAWVAWVAYVASGLVLTALAPVCHHVEEAVAVAGEDVVRELGGALYGDNVEYVFGVV
jgi:hypothetical protein